MKSIDTTLLHRVLLPEHSSAARHPAIIMLHGRGSDEEDLIGLASAIDERFCIISARAPYQFPYGGYTWYDLQEIGSPDRVQFAESYGKLSRFLDDVVRGYPIDPKRVILLGFSMGTIMSYALALTRPDAVCGVSANGGYCPEDPSLTYRWDALAGTEFFITHGTADPVIPVTMARQARDLLATAGARCTYREYPVQHAISDEAVGDIAAWLTTFLTDTD